MQPPTWQRTPTTAKPNIQSFIIYVIITGDIRRPPVKKKINYDLEVKRPSNRLLKLVERNFFSLWGGGEFPQKGAWIKLRAAPYANHLHLTPDR